MDYFEVREGFESIRGMEDITALRTMSGPTVFHIPGRDRARAVLVSTLIHGTEPAGFHALQKEAAFDPRVLDYGCDVYFLVGSPQAALTEKEGLFFQHRDIPGAPREGQWDMNRLWGTIPHPALETTDIGIRLSRTGQDLSRYFSGLPLRGFLDIHSYMSPLIQPHGCIPHTEARTIELMKKLAPRAFVVDFGLGTLLERMGQQTTSVLIESGVNGSAAADDYAYTSLQTFFEDMNVTPGVEAPQLCKSWYNQGIQFKVRHDATVAFGSFAGISPDLVVRGDIESLNHRELVEGTDLGVARSLDVIHTDDAQGRKVEDYFYLEGERLRVRRRVVPNFLNKHEARMKGGGFYFFQGFTP